MSLFFSSSVFQLFVCLFTSWCVYYTDQFWTLCLFLIHLYKVTWSLIALYKKNVRWSCNFTDSPLDGVTSLHLTSGTKYPGTRNGRNKDLYAGLLIFWWFLSTTDKKMGIDSKLLIIDVIIFLIYIIAVKIVRVSICAESLVTTSPLLYWSGRRIKSPRWLGYVIGGTAPQLFTLEVVLAPVCHPWPLMKDFCADNNWGSRPSGCRAKVTVKAAAAPEKISVINSLFMSGLTP